MCRYGREPRTALPAFVHGLTTYGQILNSKQMRLFKPGEVWDKRYSTNSPRKVKLQATATSTFGFLPRSLRNLPTRTRLIVGFAFLAWGSLGIYLIEPVEKKLGLEARGAPTNSYDMNENREESPIFPRIEVIERKKN